MGNGYAVVDVETTGLHPGWHHRIVEVAIVRLDRNGQAVDEWCTIVNPDRDLGPQEIHGITAGEARRAPRFQEISAEIADRLSGNIVVGHNVSFDLRFLVAEFAKLGVDTPLDDSMALCTMHLANRYLTTAARSLAMCCRSAGVVLENAHSALYDARATAQLLARFLRLAGQPEPWLAHWKRTAQAKWPDLLPSRAREVRREHTSAQPTHFLARLVQDLPRVPQPPRADEYLAVLDRALVDRHLSATEQDELVGVARELRLAVTDVEQLHHTYLATLAAHAWADEVVTDEELQDLRLVATLLGLDGVEVDDALASVRNSPKPQQSPRSTFELRCGDSVVFTGQMSIAREIWEERAVAAGLGVQGNVTKRTKLLVAADPDSMSGKAKKAHTYRIPVITEEAFASLLNRLAAPEATR